MPGKMSDARLKYFEAITENKKKELELKNTESKIDDLQKRMLTRYWRDKINIFDDMIRLNVRTPTYFGDPGSTETTGRPGSAKDHSYNLGPMNIDSKLLSNRPISLQRGKQGPGRMEPVISVEGTDAVCYPSKEAKRGRKVDLNPRVLRRLEQCKTLFDSIAAIRLPDSPRHPVETTIEFRSNGSMVRRPKTASYVPKNKLRNGLKRPETRVGICSGVNKGDLVAENRSLSSSPDVRPRTSVGFTEAKHSRNSACSNLVKRSPTSMSSRSAAFT